MDRKRGRPKNTKGIPWAHKKPAARRRSAHRKYVGFTDEQWQFVASALPDTQDFSPWAAEILTREALKTMKTFEVLITQ
jgi:hypothetical protein